MIKLTIWRLNALAVCRSLFVEELNRCTVLPLPSFAFPPIRVYSGRSITATMKIQNKDLEWIPIEDCQKRSTIERSGRLPERTSARFQPLTEKVKFSLINLEQKARLSQIRAVSSISSCVNHTDGQLLAPWCLLCISRTYLDDISVEWWHIDALNDTERVL